MINHSDFTRAHARSLGYQSRRDDNLQNCQAITNREEATVRTGYSDLSAVKRWEDEGGLVPALVP